MKTSPLLFGQTEDFFLAKEITRSSLTPDMDIQAVHGARCAADRRMLF